MALARVFSIVGVVFLFCGAIPLSHADELKPATQPATTAPAEKSVDPLIHQLGDADPEVRDRASKSLWKLGRLAEPALRDAAAGDDPEIARRAKSILRDFTYGLYPDAPHELFAFLDSYRKGDQADKRIAVGGLSSLGVPGLRILIKLRDEEHDPLMKQIIAQALGPREHEVAVLMLADGQAATVEQILKNSSIDSPVAAQDYTAFLQTNGKLADAYNRLKNAPPAPPTARLLLDMARASGDLPTARMAAELSGEPDLIDAIFIEQRDWKALAARLEKHRDEFRPAERLGYLCAYHRLAGDKEAYRDLLKQLADFAMAHPEDHVACANDLFLNDAADTATDILLKQDDLMLATSFLAPRMRYQEAIDLPRKAPSHQPGDLTQIEARTVGTLEFIGEKQKSQRLMEKVSAENQLRNDFATWVYLIESAREMGDQPQMDKFAAMALDKATRQDPIGWLFEKMRLGEASPTAQWWQFLHQQFEDEPAAKRLARLRSIFDQTISRPELEKLCELSRRYAVDLPVAEREQWQMTMADTLVAAKQLDLAGKWIEQLENGSSAAAFIHAGDFRADRGNWTASAEDYDKAFERDHTNAAALFLHGWALSQTGKASQGAPLMELAHRLPLGSETQRMELLEALTRHKLTEDVKKERELILHACSPRSWERNEVMRRLAEDMAEKGDNLAAADLWQQAFLQNLSSNVAFADPWANVIVPTLVHKTHAVGLIQSGKMADALDEAKLVMDQSPSDVDALIDMINALDKAGHKTEADALYAQETVRYRKAVATYPNSGPLHNQLSWAEVMCHRDLEDALINGKRAVELEPNSTASMDTLAEVDFAKGDAASAAAEMKRCIELEPRVERHHKQLERFETAEKGKKSD